MNPTTASQQAWENAQAQLAANPTNPDVHVLTKPALFATTGSTIPSSTVTATNSTLPTYAVIPLTATLVQNASQANAQYINPNNGAVTYYNIPPQATAPVQGGPGSGGGLNIVQSGGEGGSSYAAGGVNNPTPSGSTQGLATYQAGGTSVPLNATVLSSSKGANAQYVEPNGNIVYYNVPAASTGANTAANNTSYVNIPDVGTMTTAQAIQYAQQYGLTQSQFNAIGNTLTNANAGAPTVGSSASPTNYPVINAQGQLVSLSSQAPTTTQPVASPHFDFSQFASGMANTVYGPATGITGASPNTFSTQVNGITIYGNTANQGNIASNAQSTAYGTYQQTPTLPAGYTYSQGSYIDVDTGEYHLVGTNAQGGTYTLSGNLFTGGTGYGTSQANTGVSYTGGQGGAQPITIATNPVTGNPITTSVLYNPTTQSFSFANAGTAAGYTMVNGFPTPTTTPTSTVTNDYLYTYTSTLDPTSGEITTTQQLNPNAQLPVGFSTIIADANGNPITIKNTGTAPITLSQATATISEAGLNPYSETLGNVETVNAKPTNVIEENPANTAVQLNNVPVSLFGSNAPPTTSTTATGGTAYVNQGTGQTIGFQPYVAPPSTAQVSLASPTSLTNGLSLLDVNPVGLYQNIVEPAASYIGKTAGTVSPAAQLSQLTTIQTSSYNQNNLLTLPLPIQLMLSGKLPPNSLIPYINSGSSNIYNYLSSLPAANYNELIKGINNVQAPINKYVAPYATQIAEENYKNLIQGLKAPYTDFTPQGTTISSIPIGGATQNLYAGLANGAGTGIGVLEGYIGGTTNFLSNPATYKAAENEIKYLTTPTAPYNTTPVANPSPSRLAALESEPGVAALQNLGTSNYNELMAGINNVYNTVAPYAGQATGQLNLGALQPYTFNPINKQLGQKATFTPLASNPAANQFYQQLANFPGYYSNASQFGAARTNFPVTNPLAYNPYGDIVTNQLNTGATNIKNAANYIPIPILNQLIGQIAAQPFSSAGYLAGTQQTPVGTAANLGTLGLYVAGPSLYEGLGDVLKPGLGALGRYVGGAGIGAGGTELFGLSQGQQPTLAQLGEGALAGAVIPPALEYGTENFPFRYQNYGVPTAEEGNTGSGLVFKAGKFEYPLLSQFTTPATEGTGEELQSALISNPRTGTPAENYQAIKGAIGSGGGTKVVLGTGGLMGNAPDPSIWSLEDTFPADASRANQQRFNTVSSARFYDAGLQQDIGTSTNAAESAKFNLATSIAYTIKGIPTPDQDTLTIILKDNPIFTKAGITPEQASQIISDILTSDEWTPYIKGFGSAFANAVDPSLRAAGDIEVQVDEARGES